VSRADEELERAARPEEVDSVDRLEAELVVDEDGDAAPLPAGQPVHLRRAQSAEHASRTRMEHPEPSSL
jgi:hypothetical protein